MVNWSNIRSFEVQYLVAPKVLPSSSSSSSSFSYSSSTSSSSRSSSSFSWSSSSQSSSSQSSSSQSRSSESISSSSSNPPPSSSSSSMAPAMMPTFLPQVNLSDRHWVLDSAYGPVGAGSNENFTLGDEDIPYATRFRPLQVTNPAFLGTTDDLSYYIDAAGRLFGIGLNNYGQMGQNTTIPSLYDTWVQIGTGFTQVAAGRSHAIAVQSSNVLAWGYGGYGQNGQGDTTSYSSPVTVSIGKTVGKVRHTGNYACFALTNDGDIYSWGYNSSGELGIGSFERKSTPTLVSAPGVFFQDLQCHANSCLALDSDGNVWSWGNNTNGLLGDGTDLNNYYPRKVSLLSQSAITVAKIATGMVSSYALDDTGTLWTWGANTNGQLGDGTRTSCFTPKKLQFPKSIVDVQVNGYSVLFLDSDGKLWGFGNNSTGCLSLGNPEETYVTTPTIIPRVLDISSSSSLRLDVDRNRLPKNNFGQYHYSFIDSNGEVRSFGNGTSGQYGDGTRDTETFKVATADFHAVPDSMNCGDIFNVVLDTDGKLWSWGANNSGALGDGTTAHRSTPVLVALPSGVNIDQIAVGNRHVLAKSDTGDLYTWGQNNYGQLGDGEQLDRASPVSVRNGVGSVACGEYFSLLLDKNGYVYGSGINNYGQLGDGTNISRSSFVSQPPVGAAGQVAFSWLSCGTRHTIGKSLSGDFYGWGYGGYGILPGANSTSFPTSLSFAFNPSKISCGYNYNLYLDDTGTIYSNGYNNYGNCGDGTTSTVSNPAPIPSLQTRTFVEVSAGPNGSYAVESDGAIWSWGLGSYGKLGNKNPGTVPLPYRVGYITKERWSSSSSSTSFSSSSTSPSSSSSSSNQPGFPYLAQGGTAYYTMGLIDSKYKPWSWGYNNYGQLGDFTNQPKSTPVQVAVAGFFTRQAKGEYHQLLLRQDGQAYACGSGGDGRLGTGSYSTTSFPIQVMQSTSFKELTAGGRHSLAIDINNRIWAWGYNYYGQLGLENNSTQTAPTQVPLARTFRQVAAGYYHTLFRDSGGKIWATGYNAHGQLGLSDTSHRSSPVSISILAAKEIACGMYHSAGITMGGDLYLWGNNNYGQLGTNSTSNRSSPVSVTIINSWDKVALGESHSIALDVDGQVWTWGYNGYGQLGIGNTSSRSTPVSVSGFPHRIVDVSCCRNSCIAVTYRGDIYVWGSNSQGELGLDDRVNRSTPTLLPYNFYTWSSSSSRSSESISSYSKSSSSTSPSSSSSCSSSSTDSDILNGLIHRWPLTDSSGMNDIIGINHLTNNGSVQSTINGSYFNGVDQWLDTTVSIGSSFTFFMKIRPDSYGAVSPFLSSHPSNGTDDRVGIITDGDYDIKAYCDTNSFETINYWTSSKFPQSSFTSLALTCDGTTLRLYRQAVGQPLELLGSTSITSPGRGSAFSIARSAINDSGYFSGIIKDVSYYNRALNSTELRVLNNRTSNAVVLENNTQYQLLLRMDPWDAPSVDTYIQPRKGSNNGWISTPYFYSDDNWGTYTTSDRPFSLRIRTSDDVVRADVSNSYDTEYFGRVSGDYSQFSQRFTTDSSSAGLQISEVRVYFYINTSMPWEDMPNLRMELQRYNSDPGEGSIVSVSESTPPPNSTGSNYVHFNFPLEL